MLAVCGVTLLGGYLLKARCIDRFEFGRLCYNDIQPLYGGRGIAEGTFPYVDASLDETTLELRDGAIEYPVLTGVWMWGSGQLVTNAEEYLRASALLLAPFALIVAYLLARLAGARALMWAAAPAIVLYAFHNWDLLVVAAAVAGFWFWSRGQPVLASVCFGVGAAFKLYPILFLVPLALEQFMSRGQRDAARAVIAGAGTFAVINLPFVIANASGWWATFQFHRLRGPNYDNIWTWLPFDWVTPSPSTLNLITAALTAVFIVAALAVGWWRAQREGVYPFIPVCAALLVAFLLWNKVHSPQYTLWLVPFFVLVPLRAVWSVFWWLAYSVVDIVVYVGVFRFFQDGSTTARNAMVAGVWARAGILLILFAIFLFSRGRGEEALADRVLSHPPATFDPQVAEAPVLG